MNYRTATILSEKALTTTGTETIDINVKDIISRIMLSWRVSKSKPEMDSYPHKDITKIELVDGSDVLHSMNGGENQALCIYDRRVPTMNHGQALSGNSLFSTFGIDFGRFLWDPLLAFDPKKFANPQLKITYDVDVSDTGVTTGYLEIWAQCFDEKVPSPIGFLMSKEHWNAAKPTSGYEYVDIPTDYPIRKMLIQAYRAQYEPWYQVASARLDEDNEKRIPFDWTDLEDYHRMMKGIWAPVMEQLIGVAATNGSHGYYVTPTDYYSLMAANTWGDSYIYREGVRGGGYFTPYAKTQESQFTAIVYGYLPNHCFEFPFGDQNDLADWYDVTKVGSVRLRLGAGSGGSTTTGVVLQQLRKY